MTVPATTPVGQRLYDAMGPFTRGDEDNGWPLLRLCTVIAAPLADVETFAADTDAGVGWSTLLNATTCPARALPFLGQLVGVQVPAGTPDATARATVLAEPGWGRGTPASLIAAAKLWLTGMQRVTLTERVGGDAYAVGMSVFDVEVINQASLTTAVRAVLPAGLSFTLTVNTGWTVAQMESETSANTVAYVEAHWATVNDFERQLP